MCVLNFKKLEKKALESVYMYKRAKNIRSRGKYSVFFRKQNSCSILISDSFLCLVFEQMKTDQNLELSNVGSRMISRIMVRCPPVMRSFVPVKLICLKICLYS